jgi:hypothetical protein
MELTNIPDFIINNNKWIVLLISIMISGVIYIKTDKETESISTNTSSIILLLLFGIGYFFSNNIQLSNFTWAIPIVISCIIALVIFIYVALKIDTRTFAIFSYITGIIFTLIITVGLALLFYIFSNFLKSRTGWAGFMIHLVFYIPCLLLSFVNYIINEFKLTTNPVLILFIVEILLMVFYLFLPEIINHITINDGIPILEESRFLSSENTIDIDKIAKKPDMDIQIYGNTNNTENYDYAISMWTYVNIHNSNRIAYNTESNIFNYGHNGSGTPTENGDGKPRITYYTGDSSGDVTNNVHRIYFTNNVSTSGTTVEKPYYELKLPYQKWNNIIFNYKSTHVDLFINGHLERTFSFKHKTPLFTSGDTITTGSADGLNGSISNIRYYPKTLSKPRIASMYNLFMNKTPPTNNL